ncbi:MAG TPA: hypothetical protein VIX91_06905 [Candidatus Acidoferrum sp.]
MDSNPHKPNEQRGGHDLVLVLEHEGPKVEAPVLLLTLCHRAQLSHAMRQQQGYYLVCRAAYRKGCYQYPLDGLLVGAALGPPPLLIIFALLAHGHLEFPGTFKGTGSLWTFSILVSTVSFGLYVALLKRKSC